MVSRIILGGHPTLNIEPETIRSCIRSGLQNLFPKSGKDGPSIAMDIPNRQNKTMI